MGSANGDRSASRRKKRRGGQALTPTDAGEMLRRAREGLGIDLAEVHDRTGISWRNLEALESGDMQRFSDHSSSTVAVRRYAELVSLDPDPLVRAFAVPVLAYAGSPTGQTGWAIPATDPGTSGHLNRYVPDHSHLRSFTQTAQVPAVGGWPGAAPGTNGQGPIVYPPPRKRRKAPWALRFLTWLVLFLLIVGVAGLGVDHYKPQWLRQIHILKSLPSKPTTATTHPQSTQTTKPPAPAPAVVTTTKTGVGTASVHVGTSNYTVVIATLGACWVEAQTSLSVNPIINRTLQAGQSVSIPMTGGQLTVELGSLAALITVQVGGNTVGGWSLHPNAVPYVTTFTSN